MTSRHQNKIIFFFPALSNSPVESLPVQTHHDPGVGKEPIVALKLPDILELAVGHPGADAEASPRHRGDQNKGSSSVVKSLARSKRTGVRITGVAALLSQ